MAKITRARYDQSYAAIEEDILKMGSLVQDAIRNSIESLKQRDKNLAQDVINRDQRINDLRFKVEEACLTLIATQQPTAGDLRAVVAAMNIVVDMERMADHASGIAKTVIRMGDEPLLMPLVDLPKMADLARQMLSDGLKAFIERDEVAAKAIAPRDEEMDYLYKAIFDELVEIMAHKPGSVERATYLLWCGHNLERIGDRAINIVERVVFMTTGNMRELTF